MRCILGRIQNSCRVMAALLLVSASNVLTSAAGASEVSEGLAQLDAIVLEAGSAEAFLEDSPSAQRLRDQYYHQWVQLYPQGEVQFPRNNFDAVIVQVRKAVKDHPKLGWRLFETTGLGRTFQIQVDGESSGLELKQEQWKTYYESWKKSLERSSERIRSIRDHESREGEVQRLSRELDSEVHQERARIEALPKAAKLERGKAEAELQERLLTDSRVQELASYVVHEKVFGVDAEALRDVLNSGDADQVLLGMKQIQRKGALPIPDAIHAILVRSAIPALEQPKLELDSAGKASESALFRVKLRKTNRGKWIPEGRVSKMSLQFQTIPRRIHGLFKGLAIRECVGGGSCEHLSPERWGTIALHDSQLHLVVENGSLTPGFTHAVPVRVGEEIFLSVDIQAPSLNKTALKSSRGSVERVAIYRLWLKEQQRHLPSAYRRMLVGSSAAMNNGGNRTTVWSSNSYVLGRKLPKDVKATAVDIEMREVLLGQADRKSPYGGNLITETTVMGAGELRQLLPSLETLSESQVVAILERSRPELWRQLLVDGSCHALRQRYPGLRNSSAYWAILEWGLQQSDKDSEAFRGALERLNQESGVRALELTAKALEHPDGFCRYWAGKSLGKRSGPEALRLKALALENSDKKVRSAVAESLSNESGTEALRVKALALGSRHEEVRLAAANSLRVESGPEALRLKTQALQDPEIMVRVAAVRALSSESGPEALRVKAQALEDPYEVVRAEAAQTLSNESGSEALRLKALVLRDPNFTVGLEGGRSLLKSLSRSESFGQIDDFAFLVLTVAKRETYPGIRNSFVDHLRGLIGQAGHDRHSQWQRLSEICALREPKEIIKALERDFPKVKELEELVFLGGRCAQRFANFSGF